MNQRYPDISHLNVPLSTPAAGKKQVTTQQLAQAIGDSHDVLVRAQTVFPFTLFPDTVTVDRTKFSITRRNFFKMAEIISFRIEDILDVSANVGPFFGSLKIATRFFDRHQQYYVNYLKRADALKIKRIMQGYLIARKEKIDCSVIATEELARTLDELGKVAPAEKV